MHAEYPQAGKVTHLTDLVTARYENTQDLRRFLASFQDKENVMKLLEAE
jgi:hypothetical protein